MEFPLKPDFFPPLRLTSDDRHRYVATAEYSVHVLRKLVADDKWKRISDAKGVSIGKVHCIEEQAYGGGGSNNNNASASAKACLIMCASVLTTGTVSEVLETIASPVTEDYRRAMGFVYGDRFVDGLCLHTLSPNGSRNTQAFTTIKWAAFKDGMPMTQYQRTQHAAGTDYCFLEHSGIQKEANRDESFGFCIQESIARDSEVPVMTGLGLGRGELHRTGILIVPTDRRDVIQISSILQMDTATSLTKSALEKLMTRRVTAVAQIPLLLDRRRLSRMQFIPREDWVNDNERRMCVVCTKSFGLRRKHHCRHCGEVVCATCAPPREVEVTAYGVASIRICMACVVHSRTSNTAFQQDDVLVYHVRPTLSSLRSGSTRSDAIANVVSDDPTPPQRRKASSAADSNFSISSDEDEESEDEDESEEYEDDDGHSTFAYDHHAYDAYNEYHDHSLVGSIPLGTPNPLDDDDDGEPLRYSNYSEARSSDMSFSEFNTLAADGLRITSVPPHHGQGQGHNQGQNQGDNQTHHPITGVETTKKPTVLRTLYDTNDRENNPPNKSRAAPVAQRESMDEWFAARKRPPPYPQAQTPLPPHKPVRSVAPQHEYMDDWCTPRPPSTVASHTSSGSSITRESMDEWLGPRRGGRDRNHSYASTGSYVSSVGGGSINISGHDSKRSSSSTSSTSSLLEMMTSIREIQNDLAAVQEPRRHHHEPHDRPPKKAPLHDHFYLERLSEQLREPEATDTTQREPAPPTPTPVVIMEPSPRVSASALASHSPMPLRPSLSQQEHAVRGHSGSDIDMFTSDSFTLLCPETLSRQRGAQDTGERRSARISSLSASTDFDDVEDFDSMRQSELLALRRQVEGLHKSLEDATSKLNHYSSCSAVKHQATSLQQELRELEHTERGPRKHSVTDDPVIRARKTQYHELIDELHEIMGLPALATRARSREVDAYNRRG